MPFIQIQNTVLPFRLRRSQRAKRLHMIVKAPGFEVVAPKKIPNREILDFLKDHQRWMVKQVKHRTVATQAQMGWPSVFLTGEKILYRGQLLLLNIKFASTLSFCLTKENLTIFVPWQQSFQTLAKYVKKQVLNWYQQQTLEAIKNSVDNLCPKLGRWPNGYQLKQQKTRWGSCGIGEKIYINWLLILAPQGVLEYVVAHELCHLFHRNHGKRFWAKVAACFPTYEQQELWLRVKGHTLLSLSTDA